MVQEKILRFALLISCLTHCAIIFFPQNLGILQKQETPFFKDVKVNYYKLDQKADKRPELAVVKSAVEKQDVSAEIKKTEKKPTIKIADHKKDKKASDKKIDEIAAEGITLPDLPKNFPNRKQYLNYYQIVRERIKFLAYRNYVGDSTGEVFLKFTLDTNGKLLSLQVIDGRSNAKSFLKRVALKSVRDAAPYPAFPKDLTLPKLNFNIIISFELTDT